MFCIYCGKPVNAEGTFCPYCGRKIEQKFEQRIATPENTVADTTPADTSHRTACTYMALTSPPRTFCDTPPKAVSAPHPASPALCGCTDSLEPHKQIQRRISGETEYP